MPFDNVPTKKPLSPEIEADLRVLRYARDAIEAGKWCQRRLRKRRLDQRCVLGWLLHAAPKRGDFIAGTYLAPIVLEDGVFTLSIYASVIVTGYNDSPTTTRDDVVNLINRGIARAEENANAV